MKKALLLTFLALGLYCNLISQVPAYVHEMEHDGENVFINDFYVTDNYVYIAGSTPSLGKELWITDGSPNGLRLLKDINPGTANGSPRDFIPYGNNQVLFIANDGTNGTEIWISDGTSAGTRLFADVTPTGYCSAMINYNGYIYVAVRSEGNGDSHLYRTQGTEESTEFIVNIQETKELYTGVLGSVSNFMILNGKLYFECSNTIFESDGTAQGTRDLLAYFNSIQTDYVFENMYGSVFIFNDQLVFSTKESSFLYDGTTFTPDRALSDIWINRYYISNDRLFFTADNGNSIGPELWMTTTTLSEATFLGDQNSEYDRGLAPTFLGTVGDKVLFVGEAIGSIGKELYVTDGTPEGTGLLKDIYPGENAIGQIYDGMNHISAQFEVKKEAEVYNGLLFFRAEQSYQSRFELFVSDGTTEGTYMLKDFADARGVSSSPSTFLTFKGNLYFTIIHPDEGRQLWTMQGINNKVFSGQVFYDANENGVKDADEFYLKSQKLSLSPSDKIAYTNEDGIYTFLAEEDGDYTISPVLPQGWEVTTLESSVDVNLPNDAISQNDFGVVNKGVTDYAFTINTTSTRFRCGDKVTIQFELINQGKAAAEVEFKQLFNEKLQNIGYFTTPTGFDDDNNPYFSFNDIGAFESKNLTVEAYAPGVEIADVGEIIKSTFILSVLEEGAAVYVAADTLAEEIKCAYDPNDKAAFPFGEGEDNETNFKQGLSFDYTIRFENVGNDTAYTVKVIDTLDVDLDPNSFDFVGASHPVTIQQEGEVFTFLFENIMLPDSTTDKENAQGWIKFSATINEHVLPGDLITNKAYIYFDKNPAIITNEVRNRFAAKITSTITTIDNLINVYPNPFSNEVYVEAKGTYNLKVYDVVGNLLISTTINDNKKLDASALPQGLYLFEFNDSEGSFLTRKMLKL